MSHTSEPWYAYNDSVYADAELNHQIAHVMTCAYDPTLFIASDALRIVACVNACAGISTKILEESETFSLAEHNQIAIYMQQRDELLAICRSVVERGIGASDIRAMEAAIANAEAKP